MEFFRRVVIFLSGLTAVTGAIGTVTLDNIVAKRSMAAAALLAIVVAAVLPKFSRLYLRRFTAFSVSVVDSAAGVREVCRLGRTAYSSMKKPYPDELLPIGWWRKFPYGIHRIADNSDRMWMYVSIWPITETAFNRLRNGASEEDLTSDDIMAADGKPFSFFYIADICRTKRAARSNVTLIEYLRAHMLAGYLDAMLNRGFFPSDRPIEFIAHPVSIPGRNNLKEFDFIKIPEAKGREVYYRCITPKAIHATIRAFVGVMEKDYAEARGAVNF